MALSEQKQHEDQLEDNDWSLSPEQMLFLMQNHNLIERAFAENDIETLREFAASKAFVNLFDDMGFDEALDRYESTLEVTANNFSS